MGSASVVQHDAEIHDLRGAIALVGKLLLPTPLHPDAMTGDFLRDQRRIQRDVIRAIMSVTASTLRMPGCDALDRTAQHLR